MLININRYHRKHEIYEFRYQLAILCYNMVNKNDHYNGILNDPKFLEFHFKKYYPTKHFIRSDTDIRVAISLWCENRMLAEEKYGHIEDWDTSNVTNMSMLIYYKGLFNDNIEDWDVSNVTDMSGMFAGATSFNRSLNNWDVSNVTNMRSMFIFTTSFNQPLNNWDVSNVTDMNSMFDGAESFNQPLNNCDVSHVTYMNSMFIFA